MSGPSVWMVGSGGRTPFVGYFRGATTVGSSSLAWAGRIAPSASVTEGWEAAERARDVLSELPTVAAGPQEVLANAVDALGRIDPRWLGRGDLAVLLVAAAAGVAFASGTGLGGVFARSRQGWRAAVPAGHPLLGEPGVLPVARWAMPAEVDAWIALPAGLPFPADPEAACGVRP